MYLCSSLFRFCDKNKSNEKGRIPSEEADLNFRDAKKFYRTPIKKFLFRFYGHYDTFVTIEPKSGKGFFCETMLAISRISYIILQVSRQLAFSDVIQHHEMVLLPMQDGGQRAFFVQLLRCHLKCGTFHTYRLKGATLTPSRVR